MTAGFSPATLADLITAATSDVNFVRAAAGAIATQIAGIAMVTIKYGSAGVGAAFEEGGTWARGWCALHQRDPHRL